MKRDMDLIRHIVLAVRDAAGPLNRFDDVDINTFGEHALLLQEAGLIEASIQVTQHRPTAVIIWRLTWSGQDFADAITDENLWRKAKDAVIKPTASWTFGVLLEYLKGEIMHNIPGLPRLLG